MVLACVLSIVAASTNHAAQTLDLENVLEKAVKNAHEVRMSDIDIRISRSAKKEARSVYYPSLGARWNSGYVKDLTDGTAQVTSVGDMILVENTMFQNALSVGLAYDLFDFGAKGKRDRKSVV